MRLPGTVLVALPILALALTQVRDASACGGCFPPVISQMETTQVSGHRMVLSIGKTQSTLWDQITYVGNPESFAWVLPIKGMVDVGVSSDALFGTLEELTKVTINSPILSCPAPSCGRGAPPIAAIDAPGQSAGGGVTVIAQKVVGPYETVQLASTDPNALKTWLTDHGYAIPAEIEPVISAYLAEGFDFLALKLVPGQGIKSMKPVRVTTAGASPVLPLRMVAAGAGATVPLTLWILGEGKYVPSNFPHFIIPKDKLVWNWDKEESNYKSLRQEGFDKTANRGWVVEAGEPIGQGAILSPLLNLVNVQPEQSGYADAMGKGALEACEADIQALLSAIPATTLTLTRIHAELPKSALATDLTVEAASDQSPVPRIFNVSSTTGTAPACPPDPCGGSSNNPSGAGDSSGCAVAESGETDASLSLFGALFSIGLIIARRRKKNGRAASR